MNKKNFLKSVVNFIKESYIELKKVTWLSRKEVLISSLIIVILIIIMSIYIALIDFILAKIVAFFIGGRL